MLLACWLACTCGQEGPSLPNANMALVKCLRPGAGLGSHEGLLYRQSPLPGLLHTYGI